MFPLSLYRKELSLRHPVSNFFLLSLLFLCLFALSCEGTIGSTGPASPQGGSPEANDGSIAAKAFTVALSGIDLDDEIAMKALFQAVEDYYVNLDLSDLTGDTWHYYRLSAAVDKSKILSLILPDGLTTIADGESTLTAAGENSTGAFYGFTGLESVNAAGVKTVGNYAFHSRTSLTSVTLPAATNIGGGVFSGCTGLVSLSLNAATSIGTYAFSECTSLASVTLPAATSIGDGAFPGCTSLTSVTLPAAPPSVGLNMFGLLSPAITVTVKAPGIELRSPTGYGTEPATSDTTSNNWGNAFRGKGWDRISGYKNGIVQGNITLVYQNL
jgi:hypothetical protein